MEPPTKIRPESAADVDAVRGVHVAAFPTHAESELVDLLRENGNLLASVVAESGDEVVAHIAFSPVWAGETNLQGAGLAPVAVRPSHQRRGIGSQLIRDGLARCRKQGVAFVVLVGAPEYYRRFGFEPGSQFGLVDEYGAGDAFMVMELREGTLANANGLVRYGAEFAAFA